MNTPWQELIAQLLFWSGLGCLPGSLLAFIAAFGVRQKLWSVVFAFVGGAMLTHFLWYFFALGASLASTVGQPQLPMWLQFAPIGFGVAGILIFIRRSLAVRRAAKI
jgi:hypothetical protein